MSRARAMSDGPGQVRARTVTARRMVGDHPPDERDGTMVVHVQYGHLRAGVSRLPVTMARDHRTYQPSDCTMGVLVSACTRPAHSDKTQRLGGFEYGHTSLSLPGACCP